MKNNRISNLAEFRKWVKIRLVEKEISQRELARQMDIPHARISERMSILVFAPRMRAIG